MRRPQLFERGRDLGGMTPMIDVVFLLLIFFVVSASGRIRESLLPTELGSSGSIETTLSTPEPQPLTVDIWLRLYRDAEQQQTIVDMNNTAYNDLDRLKEQLRALADVGPENPVILDIADDVPVADFVDVYDTCQAAGFLSVNFAAGE